MASRGDDDRVRRKIARLTATLVLAMASPLLMATPAAACLTIECPVGLDDGAATVEFEGAGVPQVVGVTGVEAGQYAYRMRDRCLAAAETRDYCSPTDVRECPE
jgi:hypothetical protein